MKYLSVVLMQTVLPMCLLLLTKSPLLRGQYMDDLQLGNFNGYGNGNRHYADESLRNDIYVACNYPLVLHCYLDEEVVNGATNISFYENHERIQPKRVTFVNETLVKVYAGGDVSFNDEYFTTYHTKGTNGEKLSPLACSPPAVISASDNANLSDYMERETVASSRSLQLHWTPPPNDQTIETYVVFYDNKSVTTNAARLTLTDLQPATTYDILIEGLRLDNASLGFLGTFAARTSIELPVITHFKSEPLNLTYVRIRWKVAPLSDDLHYHYNVRLLSNGSDVTLETTQKEVDVLAPDCEDEEATLWYLVRVRGVIEGDFSKETMRSQFAGEWSPTFAIFVDCRVSRMEKWIKLVIVIVALLIGILVFVCWFKKLCIIIQEANVIEDPASPSVAEFVRKVRVDQSKGK